MLPLDGGPAIPQATAVDWGPQEGKRASWAGNTLHLTGEPFLGVPPENADVSPFRDQEAE